MPIANKTSNQIILACVVFCFLIFATMGILLLKAFSEDKVCIHSEGSAKCQNYDKEYRGINVGFFAKRAILKNGENQESIKKAFLEPFKGSEAIYSENVRYAIPTDFKKTRPQFEAIRTFNNRRFFSNFQIHKKKLRVGILAGSTILQDNAFLKYKSGKTNEGDIEFCENCFGSSDIDIVFYCRKKLLDLGYCNTQFMEKIKFEERKLFHYGDIIEGVEDYSDDLKTFLYFGIRFLNELTELEESGTMNSPSAKEKKSDELGILFYIFDLIKPKFGQFHSSAAAGRFVGGQISLKSPKRNRVICLMEVDSKVQGDIAQIDACIARVKNPKLELGFSNGTLPKFYN